MSKLTIAKHILSLMIGSGAHIITGSVLRVFLPRDLNILGKLCVWLAEFGISIAVADAATSGIDKMIDEIIEKVMENSDESENSN